MSILRKAITENPSIIRLAAKLLLRFPEPLTIGNAVIFSSWEKVQEVLKRDLDFIIEPVNKDRIEYVNGPFILGLDRSARQLHERAALYQALRNIDVTRINDRARNEAQTLLEAMPAGATLDVVNGYARPIASHNATVLTGIKGPNDADQMRVSRAMFHELFLNLGSDASVRDTAFEASKELRQWCETEIARRHGLKNKGDDMLGRLIEANVLDDDGIRRTLSGMLVGAIDTTATCVAQILAVALKHPTIQRGMMADLDNLERMRGWCWEALRFWPHNPFVLRQAARDTEVAGKRVKQGASVICFTLAAMHDSGAFPQPNVADPGRVDSLYLHFGGGFHPCAGRAINAVQIPQLITELLRRDPEIEGSIQFSGPFPDRLTVRLKT